MTERRKLLHVPRGLQSRWSCVPGTYLLDLSLRPGNSRSRDDTVRGYNKKDLLFSSLFGIVTFCSAVAPFTGYINGITRVKEGLSLKPQSTFKRTWTGS